AGVYCDRVLSNLSVPDEDIQLAREATARALAIDPQYAPALARLGWIAIYYDRDLETAARRLERALALEPGNPEIVRTSALALERLGRLDKAIALAEYGVAHDPVSSAAHDTLASFYMYAGRFDDAIAENRTGLSLSPGYIGEHALIGEA